jgi:hypothetical protein
MSNYEDYKKHITEDIKDCLEGMICQPILFIGSGFSIRYARTPNWEDLLKEMANLCPRIDKNFAYYKQIHNKDSAIKRETNKFKILTTCVTNNDNNYSLLSHKL